MNNECTVCAQIDCKEERCQDILQSIEEIKMGDHSIELLIKDLYP